MLVVRTSQLMLCRDIIAVCSVSLTKHIHVLCGQNVELYNLEWVLHKEATKLLTIEL
jgi:hypothetical protein